jgi:hypothetical protein
LRVPGPPRPALICVTAAAAVAVAGCSSIDASLSRQWATVNFRPDTSAAVIAAAGRTCGGEPGVRPAPVPAVPGTAGAPSSARYDVSHASTADVVRFQQCLMTHFPGSVLGVSLKDVADQG